MPDTIPILGVLPPEVQWVQRLIRLLRDPDPVTAELTRQALLYLSQKEAQPSPLQALQAGETQQSA